MSRGLIYNTEPFGYSRKAISMWEEAGYTYISGSWEDIIARGDLHKVTGLIIRLQRFVGEDVISRFPNLNFVVSATTGHDHIDLELLHKKGISLFTLRQHKEFLDSIPSTAEHTWALLLSLLRNVTLADMDVRKGLWRRDKFRGRQLRGKTIGIIGLGRTGMKIAHYARAFDMNAVYYDPFVKSVEYKGFECIEELLSVVDIISIHVHLTPQTNQMINSNVLNHCKTGAYLLNTSRGRVCDEDALVDALKDGTLAGVATDVISSELNNLTDSPLWKGQQDGLNIIISPHIGGATWEAMQESEEFIAGITINARQ